MTTLGIELTEQEKQLVSEGKLNPSEIMQHREVHPVQSIDVNEVDKIKEEIRQTNILYRDSIQKNKDLYDQLVENRKKKGELRDKIAELRIQKKKLLGLTQ